MTSMLTNAEIAAGNTTADMIWSAAYERLVAKVGGFKTYSRTPALNIEPQDLPLFAVYLLRDREQGIAPTMGEPTFKQYCHLGIAGMILQSNVDSQLQTLAAKLMASRLALYTDPSFMRLIDGIESSDTRLQFGRTGELGTAEYQMELVVCFETVWPPNVVDDYLRLHLETRFPPPLTDPLATPQVVRAWDIEQN